MSEERKQSIDYLAYFWPKNAPAPDLWGDFLYEIMFAQEQGILVIFRENEGIFVDGSNNPINISGKKVLGRAGHADMLITKILEAGGLSLCAVGDAEKTRSWYKSIDVGRNVRKLTFKEVLDSAKDYQEWSQIFVKTVEKSKIAGVCELIEGEWFYKDKEQHLSEVNMGTPPIFRYPEPTERMLVSDVVDIAIDGNGQKLEWRGLVVNNELISVNVYNNFMEYQICDDKSVQGFFKEFVEKYKGLIPPSYCLDVMELAYSDDRFAVTELNSLSGTGSVTCILMGLPMNSIAEFRKQYDRLLLSRRFNLIFKVEEDE